MGDDSPEIWIFRSVDAFVHGSNEISTARAIYTANIQMTVDTIKVDAWIAPVVGDCEPFAWLLLVRLGWVRVGVGGLAFLRTYGVYSR
jgi:hypothetical protein